MKFLDKTPGFEVTGLIAFLHKFAEALGTFGHFFRCVNSVSIIITTRDPAKINHAIVVAYTIDVVT